VAGAVRRTSAPDARPTRRRHIALVGGALVLVTTGVLAATANVDSDIAARAIGVLAPIDEPIATFVQPAFYFGDATDALAERDAERPGPPASPVAMAVALSAPRTTVAAAMLDATDLPAGTEPGTETTAPALEPTVSVSPTTVNTVASGDELPALLALRTRDAAPIGAIEKEVTVGEGDTLSGILNEHGVSIDQMPSVLQDDVVDAHLSTLKVGQRFHVVQFPDGRFHSLSAKLGHDTRVTIGRATDGFAVAAVNLPVEKERVVTSGTIDQSLYLAAEAAELKQSTIMNLADIFQWELDFARDIRKGDHFAVVYDRLYREGRYIGDGDILAAEFERGGRTHRAIRFTDETGKSGYYDPDGTSKRRTFLRHPVDVVRITSGFDPNRLHPVLHQIRAHRGVDYGAPHGSPVRATADGIVRFSGHKSAYGQTVLLQHGKTIKTLYAHLSRISDKSVAGARVRQGEVIGYVGNTGRVTGTHLHYEFRVNDTHVDPLAVEFPAAAPLPERERDALKAVSAELIAQMRRAPSPAPDPNAGPNAGPTSASLPGSLQGSGTASLPGADIPPERNDASDVASIGAPISIAAGTDEGAVPAVTLGHPAR